MASTQVLNLDRLTDRPVVLIDGQEYRLFTVDLLPPLDNHRVRALLRRADELSLKDALSAEELDELGGKEIEERAADGVRKVRRGGVLEQIVQIILDAPDDIRKKLQDWQRMEIVQSFQVPSWVTKLAPTTAAAEPENQTGETSLPASVASTQP